MELPHVENDGHAVEALGYMLAELENRVRAGSTDIPHPDIWLGIWRKALDTTRAEANPGIEQLLVKGSKAASSEVLAEALSGHKAEHNEKEPTVREPTAEDTQGRKYADSEAQSDNLVSLVQCQVNGCENMIPAEKSLPVCHEHEPEAGDAADVDVEDA